MSVLIIPRRNNLLGCFIVELNIITDVSMKRRALTKSYGPGDGRASKQAGSRTERHTQTDTPSDLMIGAM